MILFIDQHLPFHRDFQALNVEPPEPYKYYRELNLFFDKLEAERNDKITIALHPGYSYDTRKDSLRDPFNGRTMIWHKTPELIEKADLILTHWSSSKINKPCMVLTTKVFDKKTHFMEMTRKRAKELNVELTFYA